MSVGKAAGWGMKNGIALPYRKSGRVSGGGAWPTWPHFAGRRDVSELQVGLACGRRLAVGVGRDMRGQKLLASGMGILRPLKCDGFLG
jgi:hypothetical protein